MSDSIYLKDAVSWETFAALARISMGRGWNEIRTLMEPCDIAWLTFRLAVIEDTETNFPKGKWATIQRLQDILRKAVVEESKYTIVAPEEDRTPPRPGEGARIPKMKESQE